MDISSAPAKKLRVCCIWDLFLPITHHLQHPGARDKSTWGTGSSRVTEPETNHREKMCQKCIKSVHTCVRGVERVHTSAWMFGDVVCPYHCLHMTLNSSYFKMPKSFWEVPLDAGQTIRSSKGTHTQWRFAKIKRKTRHLCFLSQVNRLNSSGGLPFSSIASC